MIDLLALALGLTLVSLVLWDVFQTIVVPRPTPGWFRIGRYLVRGSWRVMRATVGSRTGQTRDRLLGLFAPAATIAFLVAWLVGLIVGYGLILYAIRDQLRPVPADFGTVVYFSASSLLTIGYGDIVADGAGARLVVLAAAGTGLGVVALVVTFLFSLYGSYQQRESSVVLLQAKAGVPPSAVVLLENLARWDLVDHIPAFLANWEGWEATVLDSHVAYPILGYFRSSHDNLSWISALGTVLDTASLVLTTLEGIPRGQAELVTSLGNHLVEDITNLGFRAGTGGELDEAAFDEVHERLGAAGYRLVPRAEAWAAFSVARASYSARLEAMANYWDVPNVSWLGGREALRSPTHTRARETTPASEDVTAEIG